MSLILERRYGRLLMAYPAEYRRARGAEMLGTLMESARPSQTWPSVADAVDLLGGALRRRLGLSTVPGLAAGLMLAAPLALAFAGGIAGYYLIAELAAGPSAGLPGGYRGFGPFLTIGPMVYIPWLAAALGRAALPRLVSRWLIGIGLAATVLVVPMAALLGLTRPTLPLLVPLLLFGLIALAGSDHAAANAERLGLALGTAVTCGTLVALTYWHMAGVRYVDWEGPWPDPGAVAGLYAGDLTLTLSVVGALAFVLIIGLVLVGRLSLRRPPYDRRAQWAAALLLVPGLPIVAPFAAVALGSSVSGASTLMPASLAAGGVLLAAAVRSARADRPNPFARPGDSMLHLAGVLALGSAVAMCGYAWLIGAVGPYDSALGRDQVLRLVWLLAALASAVLPRRGTRAVIMLAIAMTIARPADDDLQMYYGTPLTVSQGTLVALGVVAFAGLPPVRPRPTTVHLAGLAAATVLGILICAVPPWWLGFVGTLTYVPLAGVVPCFVGLIAGWQALRGPRTMHWARGAAVLLTSAGWLALTQPPPYTPSWKMLAVLGVLLSLPVIAALWPRVAPPLQPSPDH